MRLSPSPVTSSIAVECGNQRWHAAQSEVVVFLSNKCGRCAPRLVRAVPVLCADAQSWSRWRGGHCTSQPQRPNLRRSRTHLVGSRGLGMRKPHGPPHTLSLWDLQLREKFKNSAETVPGADESGTPRSALSAPRLQPLGNNNKNHAPKHDTVCVTSFTCALVSSVTASASHVRALPQGPRVSSKTVFSHITLHRVAPISTVRTHPTLVAEQVTTHFC